MAGLLVLAACSRGGNDTPVVPPATVGTEAPTTTTTDPYAVPAVIDATYVNRVLAGLDGVTGDIIRMMVLTRTIPRELFDRLRALYDSDQALQLTIDSIQSDLRGQLKNYKANPGDPKTTVTELITVKPHCVFTKVDRDSTAVGVTTSPDSRSLWIALVPLNSKNDPSGYNHTGWSYSYEGFLQGHVAPTDPCAGS